MIINYILSKTNKKLVRKMALFYLFANLFYVWLNREYGAFLTVSFNLLQCVVLGAARPEKPAPPRYVVRRERQMLRAVPDHYEYSSWRLYQRSVTMWHSNHSLQFRWAFFPRTSLMTLCSGLLENTDLNESSKCGCISLPNIKKLHLLLSPLTSSKSLSLSEICQAHSSK